MTEVILYIVFAPLLLLIFMLPLIFIFVGVDLFLDHKLSRWAERVLIKKFRGDKQL